MINFSGTCIFMSLKSTIAKQNKLTFPINTSWVFQIFILKGTQLSIFIVINFNFDFSDNSTPIDQLSSVKATTPMWVMRNLASLYREWLLTIILGCSRHQHRPLTLRQQQNRNCIARPTIFKNQFTRHNNLILCRAKRKWSKVVIRSHIILI